MAKTVIGKKYVVLISQGEAEATKEQNELVNEAAFLHIKGAVLKTKEKLVSAKVAMNQCAKANPYNLQAEIDAILEVEALEEAINLSERILKARF